MALRQPLSSARECAPDLIVAPLTGFDRQGGRIGYGAGHYDRAFQRYPGAHRIGFAWAIQEVAAVPHDPWDVRLHAIATEREFIRI
jgi:5-formyltetrahydrofolate cyclo-ligase